MATGVILLLGAAVALALVVLVAKTDQPDRVTLVLGLLYVIGKLLFWLAVVCIGAASVAWLWRGVV